MDITYTCEFDAKRFERSVKRALSFSFRGATVFFWCIVAAWLLLVFRQWLGGWPEDGRSFLFVMPIFFAIHGKDDPRRPLPFDTVRAKVVRLLSDVREPDERLYLFVPDEEYDKVGLYARYGNWSCEAFYPCGCACPQNGGYFDHIKQLHKPTVYLESEKSAWLEKVRPLAKELYEKDDE